MVFVAFPPYDILLVNVDGEYFAIENACPHSGLALHSGSLLDDCVICPGHGWQINLATGRVRLPRGIDCRTPRYRVAQEGEDVVVYNEKL